MGQVTASGSGILTIGLDVGDRWSRFCVLDSAGDVIEEGRIATNAEALSKRFGSEPCCRIALEVGTHSPWISRLLAEASHEVLVANARQLRLIHESDKKNDRLDAERLARLARLDPKLLCPIQHRGREAQEDLAVLRSRDALVRVRTLLVNHIKGAMKSVGTRAPSSSTKCFHEKIADLIPEGLEHALRPIVETLGTISGQIQLYDARIEYLAEKRHPETKLLRQVSGVGPLTSLAYVLTIEDPARFKKSRMVGPYLGLKPRQSDSGMQRPQLRISKAGDVFLRRLLVLAAHYVLGPFGTDCDLRRWGLSLAQRGGKNAKKRAVVAVARRLAVLLHRLWVTGAVYEPLLNSMAKSKEVRQQSA